MRDSGVRSHDASVADDFETYGLDRHEVEALKQSIQELETQLKANNARVAVNFKAPAEYFGLIDRQIDELLAQIPEDAMTKRERYVRERVRFERTAEQPMNSIVESPEP